MEEEILEKLELLKKAGCKMVKCKVVDKNIELNKKIIELKNNSIPTSVVQEKIKELDKEKLKYDNDLRIYTLRNTFDFQKEVLQEILEEGRR